MSREKYDAWEAEQDISPVSPEAFYAEKAWNAALKTVKADMVKCGLDHETAGLDLYITE